MHTQIRPKIVPALDSGFQPAALGHRQYLRRLDTSGKSVPLVLGIERHSGYVTRYETRVRPEADAATLDHVARMVKFLLWAYGGWRIWFGGPKAIGEHVRRCYSADGARRFDAALMARVYERPFTVTLTDAASVPEQTAMPVRLGGHLDGCRLGFDLGASDYKVAAVMDGKAVFSKEFPWNPRDQADPEYHYGCLHSGLKEAAAFLPRVEAIGGSSAGVIVDNKVMVASLFRSVPASRFDEAKTMFLRLRDAWKVPLEVANDGDVTALAGAMALKVRGILGIAMGSSEAAGYIDPQGAMTGWLNELAFAPVDYGAHAPVDEWSGDRGVGALYFSQQALPALLPAAGILLPEPMELPERLQALQRLAAQGDARAGMVYATIGVYLGYAIAHYAAFYAFGHLLMLGRVTSGEGGSIVLHQAREVLKTEFPGLAEKIQLHLPDEKFRRVGQAVAAASLPALQC